MAGILYVEVFLIALWLLALSIWKNNRRRSLINWPVIGMLPSLLRNSGRIHDISTEVLRKCRRGTLHIQGPWFANMDMLATVDPENVHYIMTGNFLNFPKGPKFREIFDVLGDGIFNADSDSWKDQRNVARALITHRRFHRFLSRISGEKMEKGLIPVLEMVSLENRVIDLQDLFQRLTFDTTCVLVTGYDPGCLSVELRDVPFSKAMDDAEEAIFMRHVVPETVWKLQRWVGIGAEKKMSEAWKVLDSVIGGYIEKKRKEMAKGVGFWDKESEEGTDLLTSYMGARNGSKDGIQEVDDKFLRDTILNFMIAGRDTTSSALTWLMWLVSTHPEVERKIREEIKSILPSEKCEKWRVFSVEETKKLVYVHGAILEALRLYPPVPFQHKEPVSPGVLPSGHFVHPKMKVMFSSYAMGRMEFLWGKDCSEFKPERWILEGGSIKHEPSYKFLSVQCRSEDALQVGGGGRRIKAVATTLIHNYRVQVAEGHHVTLNSSVILYMRDGLKVKVANRWSTN